MLFLKYRRSQVNSCSGLKAGLGLALVLFLVVGWGGMAAGADKFARIKKAGKVTVVHDAKRDKTRTGLTKFKYNWKWNFSYNYNYRERGGKVYLTIMARAGIKPTISHQIYMPELGRGDRWHDRLLASQ